MFPDRLTVAQKDGENGVVFKINDSNKFARRMTPLRIKQNSSGADL